jgi:hypothetical protein
MVVANVAGVNPSRNEESFKKLTDGDTMKPSKNGLLLNRGEVMFLSAGAGLGLALSNEAHGSDSIKTGVHQQPGGCSTPARAIANTQ